MGSQPLAGREIAERGVDMSEGREGKRQEAEHLGCCWDKSTL